jgi:hypothetical protein
MKGRLQHLLTLFVTTQQISTMDTPLQWLHYRFPGNGFITQVL